MGSPIQQSLFHRLSGVLALLPVLLVSLASCGGGGGNGTAAEEPPPAAQGEFTATGVVVGLEAEPMGLELTVTIHLPGGGTQGWNEFIWVGNGPFAFTRKVPAGTTAAITASPGRLTPVHACRPTSAEGYAYYSAGGASAAWKVLDVQRHMGPIFVCGPGHRLRGTGSGTASNGAAFLDVLADGEPISFAQRVDVPGPFVLEEGYLLPGETYQVQSRSSGCRVLNATGVMPARDVDDIVVECGLRTVRYQVIGLVGSGLQVSLTANIPGQAVALQEARTHEVDGTFTFEAELNQGDTYSVTVSAAPTGPKQECSVEKGVGVVADADVTDVVVRCPGLLRDWRFYGMNASQDRLGAATLGVVYDSYLYPEPTISNTPPSASLGLQHLDLDIYKNLFDLPGAQMAVYSNETGKTFWVATETPSANIAPRLTRLNTYWWMRKTKDVATIKFQITDVWLDAAVDGAGRLFGLEPAYLESLAGMELRAARIPAGATLPLSPFYWAQDVAHLSATLGPANAIVWDFKVLGQVDGPWAPLFDESMFDVQKFGGPFSAVGAARVSLNKPMDLVIDLSQIGPNDRVMLTMQAFAMVRNVISSESLATAYFRDPAEFDANAPRGGITITEMDGLELVEPGVLPADYQPTPDTTPAAACAAPASERALVQFGAGAYAVAENDTYNRTVTITRTGSTVGEVTARLLLAPGTAAEGADFTRREFFVRFASGSATPRSVTVPLIDDSVQEGPETMQLSLVDVSGCADLGPRSLVTLTILDDDTPPTTIPTFAIGGTVTGLAGSGLTIQSLADPLPITGNGAFQFARLFPAGYIYRIQVTNQPQNPRQVCTVANGEGTVTTASISNVQITCATLPDSGSLDPNFGTGGRAWSSDLSVTAYDTALARQADGKLLMVAGGNRLVRLLPNGMSDPSFGTAGDGAVVVTSGQRVAYNLVAVAVQPDGRILVAGLAPSGVNARADMVVARYDANGVLDTGFASGQGIATFDFGTWNDGVADLVLQADGSILLVGTVSNVSGNGDPSDFAVLRLTAGGRIDTSYGASGWARLNVAGGYDVAWAGALTPDGGLVVVGRVAASGGANADIGIVKFTAAGVPDTAFGPNGNGVVRPITPAHEEARDVLVQADGRILVVGRQEPAGGTKSIWLARYLPNGQLDTGFGTQGVTTMVANLDGTALALKPDGSILVAGELLAMGATQADYGVARFTAQGQPDATFGRAGVLSLDFFGGFDVPGAMLLQPDGLLLVAGKADNGSSRGRGLARLVP